MFNRFSRLWLKLTLILSVLLCAFAAQAEPPCSYLDQWQQNKIYFNGDKVGYLGNEYTANYWTLGNNPQDYSGPWQQWNLDGPCTDLDFPPSVSFLSPLDGSVFALNDSAIISIDATDTEGPIQSVELFISGQSAAVLTAPPFTYDWIASVEGNIQIRAVATDQANQQRETSITVKVGNTTNIPPVVQLTSPADGSEHNEGNTVSIAATATDQDGQITNVDFYVDDLLISTDSTAPFAADWIAVKGNHQIKASATDNANATTFSLTADVNVIGDTNPGQCAGVPAYAAGTSYNTGDLVTNVNRLFHCDVAGWCSSSAAWAYEPGVGQHWQMAWTDQGECDTSTKPIVNITTPSENAIVLAGSQVAIEATASDADGSVSQVEFFVNEQSIAVDQSAPYTASWLATNIGETRIAAVATDNENNQSVQSTVLVSVSDEPVVTSITSPSNGTSVSQGSNVQITATASSISGDIVSVTFFVNGTEVDSDVSAPYSFNWAATQTGNFTVTSRATDNQGNFAISNGVSISVVSPTVNEQALVGYWHNFVNGSGCPFNLSEISNDWDVIVIAFADNDRNSNGTLHFNLYNGDIHSSCAAIDAARFKSDISSLKASGKKVVLSLGGAEGTITLNNASDEANFVSSLTDIINEWGFDGLDIDLESGSNLLHGTQIQARLPGAVKQIQTNIGRSMYLSMAPEHPYVQGGMIAYSGIWGAYIPVIDALRDDLDLLHVQLYNNGGLANPYMTGAAPAGSIDMMVASARMLIEGFDLADGSRFQPLRPDQVALGLPSGPSSANSGLATNQNIIAALDCIMKSISCDTVESGGSSPTFGGVMTWSINWDKHDGFIFSRPIGEKLHQ